ncbi:sensor histidine kinase [Streptomyces sp.]
MRWQPVALDAAMVAVATVEVWATRSMGGPYALAASSLAAAALALRRRLPLPVFAATLPALSLGYIWLAPMAALYTIAAGERRRRVVAACTAAVAFVSFYPWPWLGHVNWEPAATVLAVLLSALLATAPTALGLLAQSRRELTARLAELAAGRERERRLAAEQAVVRERTRMAREMHDTVAHHISLIAVQSGALEVTARTDDARAAAGAVRELSRGALDELRRMVGLLRLPVDAGQPEDGPGLADLPALLTAAGPAVRGDLPAVEDCACPAPVQHAAYRTVQEALTNVRKHAPGAVTDVVLRLVGDDLLVAVRNGPSDGAPGPALPSGGHGLTGLRERATQLGGTLLAEPDPDGGFLVRAVLPLGETRR